MKDRPTKLAFEQHYSDDSGVEYAVRFDRAQHEEIEIEHVQSITIPLCKLEWLIGRLKDVRTAIGFKDVPDPSHK